MALLNSHRLTLSLLRMKYLQRNLLSYLLITVLFLGGLGSVYSVHLCVEKAKMSNISCDTKVIKEASKRCCCSKSTNASETCSMKKDLSAESFTSNKSSCCLNINAYFNIPLYHSSNLDYKLFLDHSLINNFTFVNQQLSASYFNEDKFFIPFDIHQENCSNEIIIRHCVFLI